MRQASAQVIAVQKQLESKYAQAQSSTDEWYRRAQLALSKGDEDLAREALKRRQTYETSSQALKTQLAQQSATVTKLVSSCAELEQKLADAKQKKASLKARAQSAKAQKKATEMLSDIGSSNAYSAFERMEEKVVALEAETDALSQLSSLPDVNEKDIMNRFSQLEDNSVEKQLAELKASDTSFRTSGSLPDGRKPAEAIEDELDELRRRSSEP